MGTTPRAIRHYHQIGLLAEPERGSDGHRLYGYEEMIRLLWIRKMADAGIALDDIRDAFADAAPADADSDQGVEGILERLEEALVTQEAELRRQRAAVQRMRKQGSRMGLLSDFVARRLEGLPEGALRQADLDNLLVMERIFSPLGAAVNATRYIALQTVIEGSGLAAEDDALLDAWDAEHPAPSDDGESRACSATEQGAANALASAARMMPYDYSPARLRCMELTMQLNAEELVTS